MTRLNLSKVAIKCEEIHTSPKRKKKTFPGVFLQRKVKKMPLLVYTSDSFSFFGRGAANAY